MFKGATAVLSSSDCRGLMLVDLILRDVRFYFTDVPDLLSEGSSKALILPVAQEHELVVIVLKAMRMKWGHRRPMSDTLNQKLRGPSPNSMLPLYLDRLAVGKLSCEAAYGESRILNCAAGCLEDMVD